MGKCAPAVDRFPGVDPIVVASRALADFRLQLPGEEAPAVGEERGELLVRLAISAGRAALAPRDALSSRKAAEVTLSSPGDVVQALRVDVPERDLQADVPAARVDEAARIDDELRTHRGPARPDRPWRRGQPLDFDDSVPVDQTPVQNLVYEWEDLLLEPAPDLVIGDVGERDRAFVRDDCGDADAGPAAERVPDRAGLADVLDDGVEAGTAADVLVRLPVAVTVEGEHEPGDEVQPEQRLHVVPSDSGSVGPDFPADRGGRELPKDAQGLSELRVEQALARADQPEMSHAGHVPVQRFDGRPKLVQLDEREGIGNGAPAAVQVAAVDEGYVDDVVDGHRGGIIPIPADGSEPPCYDGPER